MGSANVSIRKAIDVKKLHLFDGLSRHDGEAPGHLQVRGGFHGCAIAVGAPKPHKDQRMSNDDYVYDEASGEWVSAAATGISAAATGIEVRDSVGNLLADGDSVTLIKDLKVKGANQTLKRGTLIKSIRLTGDDQEIDCRYEGIKGLVLRAEFVRKR